MSKVNKDNDLPRASGRHSGFWLFLLTMMVSFCVLGICFLLLLYYTRVNGVLNEKSDVPYVSEYRPRKEENMTLLVLGCESPESPLDMIMLIKYDAPKGTLQAISIPPTLICKMKSGREDTLRGQYDYAGIGGCTDGLESFFGIKIDRYMRVQQLGISNLVDFFGGVPYNLQDSKEIAGEVLMAGEQLLDGRRFAALCLADVSDELQAPDIRLQSELTSILMKGGLKTFSPTRYSGLSTALFYNSETNVTQYDFALRQEGFLNSIKKESLLTNSYPLKGDYNSDYSSFYPNDQSVKDAKAFLGIF